jgi:N6-L-threonylcarbamoyladenine synthase
MYYIGIDTSCYTTSVAIINSAEKIIYDGRILLKVERGGRGLRQSEAVFQHIRNLEPLCKEAMDRIDPQEVGCIAVSSKPRNIEGSYMPVFMLSEMLGRLLSAASGVPFFPTTHQENHIRAVLGDQYFSEPFYAIHLSGGTSELLYVSPKKSYGYDIEIKGETQDLHAGQFVDRVGVSLGLGFPCGPELEKAASGASEAVKLPCFVKGGTIGFSGAETAAKRLVDEGAEAGTVAAGVYECLGSTMKKWIENIVPKGSPIVLAGGVFSSGKLRSFLLTKLTAYDFHFTEADISRDNAVGCALLGADALRYRDAGM